MEFPTYTIEVPHPDTDETLIAQVTYLGAEISYTLEYKTGGEVSQAVSDAMYDTLFELADDLYYHWIIGGARLDT